MLTRNFEKCRYCEIPGPCSSECKEYCLLGRLVDTYRYFWGSFYNTTWPIICRSVFFVYRLFRKESVIFREYIP